KVVSVRAGRVGSRTKYSSASQRSGFSFTGVTSLSTHSRRLFAIERSRRGGRPRARAKKVPGRARSVRWHGAADHFGHVPVRRSRFVTAETFRAVAAVPQRWRRRDSGALQRQ